MAATHFANPVFFCGNENRRERVRTTVGAGGTPLLNGMDYLEVANEAQTELELHFIHPLPGQSRAGYRRVLPR